MKDLISMDVLLSSFGGIEGGIIILNPKGYVLYVNEWILKKSIIDIKKYENKTLNEIFENNVNIQLINAIDDAINSSLSRVISHKIHKDILPLRSFDSLKNGQPLNVSAFISPLKEKVGILIRIVDYSSLVKKEKQIKINETLLRIEKDYFIKSSDENIKMEDFIENFLDRAIKSIGFINIDFLLIKNDMTIKYPKEKKNKILIECEKLIRNKAFDNDILEKEIDTLSSNSNKKICVLYFSGKSIKGVLEFSKKDESIIDTVFEKTLSKIKSLIQGLIESKINYEKLNHIATHDNLTDLYNRSYLNEKFNSFKQKHSNGIIKNFTLFFVDLNKFKNLNDEFGHRYGDKVLIKIAQRIKNSVDSQNGAVFRIGGDEFVVMKEEDNSQNYVDNLKTRISSAFLCESNVVSITASIGSASFPRDGTNLDDLMHVADEKMYTEK